METLVFSTLQTLIPCNFLFNISSMLHKRVLRKAWARHFGEVQNGAPVSLIYVCNLC